MKKQDIWLILLILVLALGVYGGFQIWNREAGEDVVVYAGEEEIARFSLKEETEYTISTENHGENQLVIQNGQADVVDASCPDKVCVKLKPISETGETIVCLPNQVIVTIEASKKIPGG